MKDIFTLRRENLMRVILDRFHGNKASFSRSAKVHQNHTNLLTTDNLKLQRNLGEVLARRIERELDIPDGWLDLEHGPGVRTFVIPAPPIDNAISRAMVRCTSFDSIKVTDRFIAEINPSDPQRLILTTVTTEEMSPLINVGDTVIVDTGITAVTADGVYVLTKADVGLIRAARWSSDDGFTLSVANKSYQPDRPEQLKGMKVVGKVVKVIRLIRL